MTDFISFVTQRANSVEGSDDLTWRVVFADGEAKRGKLEHLGGEAYVLHQSNDFDVYFAASQVIRLNVSN